MKILNTSFEDYIESNNKFALHKNLLKLYEQFPDSISDLKNIIFYGPKGVGKYTQALLAIRKYSPSGLKYEKKISVVCNKNNHFLKISDIHFEIDMSLLSCNSKLLWNDLFNHIVDIVLTKATRTGIIMCKYFHETHCELLETFYSYMQDSTLNDVKLCFIIITEAVSFIPDSITNCSHIINVQRPSRTNYNKCINHRLEKHIELCNITNIKHIPKKGHSLSHIPIYDEIIQSIINVDDLIFSDLRDNIYNILIYDLDVNECTWYIINTLIGNGYIKQDDLSDVLIRVFNFFQYYNNNYRPIYHLEGLIFYLIKTVHGF